MRGGTLFGGVFTLPHYSLSFLLRVLRNTTMLPVCEYNCSDQTAVSHISCSARCTLLLLLFNYSTFTIIQTPKILISYLSVFCLKSARIQILPSDLDRTEHFIHIWGRQARRGRGEVVDKNILPVRKYSTIANAAVPPRRQSSHPGNGCFLILLVQQQKMQPFRNSRIMAIFAI